MEGKRFIRTIRLQNILSYGPDAPELRLEPLNVLIGPNASGKSNLLDALSILQSAPRDLPRSIRRGGGTHEWLWKGRDDLGPATVDVTVDYPNGIMPLRYLVSFSELRHRFDLRDERIENERPQQGKHEPYLYYRYQQGRPVLNVRSQTGDSRFDRSLQREDVHPEKSILSQRRDPDSYPELTISDQAIRPYRTVSPMVHRTRHSLPPSAERRPSSGKPIGRWDEPRSSTEQSVESTTPKA